MGPVLRDIKDAFDEWKSMWMDASIIRAWIYHSMGVEEDPYYICNLDPFMDKYWMHLYLFPEIIQFKEYDTCFTIFCGNKVYPCGCFDEDEILRIMAEHGLL